jgi:hypothetical protein
MVSSLAEHADMLWSALVPLMETTTLTLATAGTMWFAIRFQSLLGGEVMALPMTLVRN